MRSVTLPSFLAIHRWPLVVWFSGIGIVFLIRFPVQFVLQRPFLMDFELFRAIAIRILDGQGAHLYDPTGSAQSLFKYAPCWALFMIPFGWLSSQTGAIAWGVLTTAWLLLTCRLADRLCRLMHLRPLPFLAVPAIVLLVRPLLEEFSLGQTNLLWGMLVGTGLFFELTHRRWRAAACLALAISLKLPAMLFLVYFAIRKSWKLVGRTLVLLALINGASAALLFPADPLALFRAWLRVLASSGPDRAFEIGSQSFLALMGRLLRHDGYGVNLFSLSTSMVTLVAGLCQFILFGGLVASRRRLAEPTRTILDGALLAVFMVLFSPTCWVATYTATLFAVIICLAVFLQSPGIRRNGSVLVGILLTVVFSALTSAKVWHALGIRSFRGESYVYLVLMILPLFGLSLAWTLWRQRRVLARGAPA